MKYTTLMLAALTLVATSCNNKNKSTQPKENGLARVSTQETKGGNIAYVELDSFATKYQYCIDQTEALKQKQASYQQKLQSEENALTNLAYTVQRNAQKGVYKSEDEYKRAMASGQQKQQTYMQHQQQYSAEMEKATNAYYEEFHRRVKDYLKEYNKDGRYAMILTNSAATVNVLYAEPSLNITDEVIEGLNKQYKK